MLLVSVHSPSCCYDGLIRAIVMIVCSNDLKQNVDDSAEAADGGPSLLAQGGMQHLPRRADVSGTAELLLQTRDDWPGVWVVPRHLH